MINLETEEPKPLKEVCKTFPGRKGKGVALSTVWRWILHGRKSRQTGRVVKLGSIQIGGRRYSSREAAQRFTAALNAEDEQGPYPNVDDRKEGSEVTDRQLEAEGF
jgi:hypothetical protein